MRGYALVVAAACLLPACATAVATTSTPAAHAVADPGAALARDLDALFRDPAVAHTQWGVHFVRPDGAPLYGLDAAQFMVPASNQKVLSSVAAASRLGWDFTFTTRLLATAPLGADGVIDGDVVVTSNGDPTINPRHPVRWRAFDDWALLLRARGVRVINGRLIGDDNAFAEPAWGVGWAWDNLQYGYGAPPSGLQFNENQVEVTIGPGLHAGAPAVISLSPAGSGLVVEPAVLTTAEGSDAMLDIARVPGSPRLVVRGTIGAGARPATMTASVENPTRFYLAALRDALSRHDIIVGGIADIDEVAAPPPLDAMHELLVDRSPPLVEIVDVTMKWSRNIYAESLLLAMAPAGEPATGPLGVAAMRDALSALGIAPESYLSRDGSGLSRYDYIPAETLTRLLRRVLMDPAHAAPFRSTLPVAGVSGSLASRMKGTVAEGRVAAKTGTLSNVRSLSGYATTLDGDTIVFAMIANNFRLPTADIDAIMEAALARVITGR